MTGVHDPPPLSDSYNCTDVTGFGPHVPPGRTTPDLAAKRTVDSSGEAAIAWVGPQPPRAPLAGVQFVPPFVDLW
jgi:hypothetical protein